MPIVLGLVSNLILSLFLVFYYLELLPYAQGGEPTVPPSTQEASSVTPNLAGLNVRLSTRPIHPPTDQVKRMVLLQGVKTVKPLVGEPIRAAVLEDDARTRAVVLSTEENSPDGSVHAYVLYDLDVERYLPQLVVCSRERRCAHDRTPGAGGLGCVAICLVELLRQ